jgi:guanosine-3',5'-bis(diphosphate) 3'-pyrophosphohydrolase
MPYICHPLAVMISLNTDDQEVMAIAVLHDIVEDCKVSYEQLESESPSYNEDTW